MPQTNHPVTADQVCRCAGCQETFSGIITFDRHRVDGSCCHPSDVGLQIDERPAGTLWADPVARQRVADTFPKPLPTT